ncbi:MAG TPA: hypothetical protein VNT99_16700, partial [Methylomirabilota bacterium]|nr:hypothetical protein [Methylomirabilota bacterium]
MKKQRPIEVRQGNITVKIYRVRDGSTASGIAFQVADKTGEKRKLHTFADEHEARQKATDIAT